VWVCDTVCVPQLVPALLEHPLSELSRHVHFIPGVPVRPMLAKATTGVGEVLDKFSGTEFTCEYKYDGERVQVGGCCRTGHPTPCS
jgi:DNA ligase-1